MKAFGRPRFAWFVSFVFLVLACFILPQQAAAQNSISFLGSTITFSDAEPVDEGGTARFELTVQPAFPAEFNSIIRYTAGSASLGDLGSDRPTSIEWNTNDTSYTIEVPIHDDDTVEDEETFTVTIGLSGSLTFVQATGTINASDGGTSPPATVAPAITTQPVNQSVTVGGSATFTVAATGTPTPTYQWRFDGTAIVGATSATYTLSNAALTNAGDYTVVVTNTAGTVTSTAATLTVTAAENSVINLSAVAAASEADNRLNFRVDLVPQLDEDVTVAWAVTGGTTTSADFSGYASSGTVTIDADQGNARIRFRPVDDDDVEGNETLELTISADSDTPLPDGVTIGTATATGTLTDNDTPDARVSIANASVAENAAAGTIGFTVSLDRAVDSDVTLAVAYAVGTATLADDLGTRPTTVTIDRGETEATLTVPVTNDPLVEGNETFTVTLSEGTTSLPDDVTIGTGVATGTITDADTAGVSLSSTVPPASEGGTITFTVELDRLVAERFSLGWTASDGTATVKDDLDDQSGTVEIAANAKTATFTVPITNDDDTESSETFTVALTGAPTGLVNIAPSRITVDRTSATGTINASDAAGGNRITIANRTVAENVSGGSIGFTISLARAVDSDVTLAVTYAPGLTNPVTLADDLGTLPTTVTIKQGDTSGTLAVPIANEILVEGDETFTVTLREDPANPLPAGVDIGNGTATGTLTNDDGSEIVLTVTNVSEAEATLTFQPELTVPLAQDLVLAWSVTGGTASAADFSEYTSSGTVTIPARQSNAPIRFQPLDDDLTEGGETLTLTVAAVSGTALPDGVTFRRDTVTATITDTDEADINLGVVADVSETDERLTFRPELTRQLTQDITVSWEVTGGTASADDFSEYTRSGTVTIRQGQESAPIHFMPLDDDAVEGDETLEVTISAALGTLPRGVNLGTTTATATIADSDEVPDTTVSIANASAVENSGTATFTATLSRAVDDNVVLAVAVTAGTGTNPVSLTDDLGDLPTSVMIDQGQTEATFTVPINDDTIVEGDETFTVTLSEGTTALPEGVTIGTDNTATGTITENDTAEITLTANTATANENGGTFNYTVNLSAAADEAVIVRWTATDGTATVTNDLQETTNTVTFAANTRTAQTFTISPTNDNEDEDNETFTVTLEVDGDNPLPTGVTIGTNNSATATITDNDDTPVVTATVSIDDESVAENGGNAEFTVSLTTAVDSDVTLAVAYAAGTATLATDLGTRPDTVTIDANTTEATLLVPITNDNIVEGNEDFTVTISEGTTPLPEGVTIGTDNTATGTITNDDAAEVTLSPSTLEATEGNSFSYTVRLSAPADEAVNITWTASIETGDNADLAADLQTTTNTVTFAANDNADKTFTIATTRNTEDEPNKTFTVTLTPTGALPTGVTIPTATARSAATIADDDDPLPGDDTTVSIGNVSVAENVSGGNARFTVSLNRAVTSNVVLGVTYAAGVTNPATLADDLGNLSTTVTINRGDTEATLTVPIINDPVVEGNETFTVTIAVNTPPEAIAPQEGVSIGNGVATGTIIDDDRGLVTLSPPTLTAAENGTFSYNVNLSAAADEAVTVRWTASAEAGDTATVADDLQETTGTVTFNADTNTNQTFTIRPADDDTDEPNETFTVTLTPTGTLPTGVTIPTATASSAATITDNDDPVPPPPPPPPPGDDTTVSIANVSIAENVSGGNARFTVTLSRAVTSPVVLDIAYTAGTADLEADLGTPLPPTVTIPASSTSATFDVPIIDDTTVEDNETFTVTITLNTAPTGVTITDGVATGMIDDNDTAPPPPPTGGGGGGGRPADPVLVSLSPPTATAPEDGVFTYTVNISEAADEAVNITWTASDGSATVADDLQEFTGTVTFPANRTTAQTFTIRPVDDPDVEENETFTVTLTPTTTLPRDVEIDEDNAGSTATIMDNDEVAPPPVVNASVNIDDVTVAEDVPGGNVRFTVILDQAVTSDIVLNVAYAASGANPATLADDLGTPRSTTVTIPANATNATIDVPIIDDDIVEGDETFTVTVSEGTTPLPAGVTIEDGEAIATIIDNDEAPPVNVTVSIADAAPVAEDAGPARFMVSLTDAVGSAVVLDIAYTAGSASLADIGNSRPATVTIETGETSAAIDVPIIADDIAEGEETFTVTITVNTAPTGVTIANGSATGTIERSPGRPPEPSALIEPRRSGAGTALRRHVDRFDNMTGSMTLNRLNSRQTRRLSGSENLGNGAMVVGGGIGETSWGAWIDAAWAGFDGTASGQQADLYGGVDYLDTDGNWVIGALIGFEAADLDIGEANYRSDYSHIGFYGGARLSERLLFDGAASYGTATPDIDIVLGNDSVSYDAERFTVRGALTGDFGLEISLRGGSSVTVEPQIDLLYARERLGAFTDSAGGVAEREELELGRFSAGPRLTWDFEGGQVVGGVRMRGDFLQLGDGIEERVSGAANIGLRLNPRPNFTIGFQFDVDGIGITDDYTSFGGRVEFDIRF